MQWAATCCSGLQCVAVGCNALQWAAVCCRVKTCTAVCPCTYPHVRHEKRHGRRRCNFQSDLHMSPSSDPSNMTHGPLYSHTHIHIIECVTNENISIYIYTHRYVNIERSFKYDSRAAIFTYAHTYNRMCHEREYLYIYIHTHKYVNIERSFKYDSRAAIFTYAHIHIIECVTNENISMYVYTHTHAWISRDPSHMTHGPLVRHKYA